MDEDEDHISLACWSHLCNGSQLHDLASNFSFITDTKTSSTKMRA